MARSKSEDTIPTAPWVVIENGSPFSSSVDENDEEDDEFGWELAIARSGSHGTHSWGWFHENKLMVSAGTSLHAGSMTPTLWEALKKLAHEECARMNKSDAEAVPEARMTFVQRVQHASSDSIPFIQVVRSAPGLKETCVRCGYLALEGPHWKCYTPICPAKRLTMMKKGALQSFQDAFPMQETVVVTPNSWRPRSKQKGF